MKDTPPTLLEQLQTAASAQDVERVVEMAAKFRASEPDWRESRRILGRIFLEHRRFDDAILVFSQIALDESDVKASDRYQLGECHFQKGQLSKAVTQFRKTLELSENHSPAHARLAFIFAVTGQRWEADSHLYALLQLRKATFKYLLLLIDPTLEPEQSDFIEQCQRKAEQDPLPALGLISESRSTLKSGEMLTQLQQLSKSSPDLVAIHATIGELLLNQQAEDMPNFFEQLPEDADSHPGSWFVKGLYARSKAEPQTAIRCFAESVRRAPTDYRANLSLAQSLAAVDSPHADAFSERATRLKEISETVTAVMAANDPRRKSKTAETLVELLVAMGRKPEALAWTLAIQSKIPNGKWYYKWQNSLASQSGFGVGRFAAPHDLIAEIDLSEYQLKSDVFGVASDSVQPTEKPASMTSVSNIQFDDQAAELGVKFAYHQANHSMAGGVRIFESTGGGVAILDADADGNPDLFLTQGEDWKLKESAPTPSRQFYDRCFRNTGTEFVDITERMGLSEEDGYGQGCSVGDINNDGFDDLYVANVGGNQLLINNGDGTFTDTSKSLDANMAEWTSSCMILDLNGDSLPDLLDVNYLQGYGVYFSICKESQCSPVRYEGAPDTVHLSNGDGTFRANNRMMPQENAKGLGVVAWPSPKDRRLFNLFIANDQVANFQLTPSISDHGELTFKNQAVSNGVAFSGNGDAQACMGVAANYEDEQLQLFVTNFQGETNTLYVQDSSGFFVDKTGPAGLRDSGLAYVGWGTQFLDADNDGLDDLVATNGHVADFGEANTQYEMPTQFFRGIAGPKFEHVSQTAGELFQVPRFGRSLARLDWNSDGRTDFVISVIGQNAVVATNQSESKNKFLRLKLSGRSTTRDAFGTRIRLEVDGRSFSRTLLGGCGFQASNERLVTFGLGPNVTRIDRLKVDWPSGKSQDFTNISALQTVAIVEGGTPQKLIK